jgi:predicted house-cleaning noncanonical NTP pyrophosphatase (MazG superfamily)
MSWKLVRDHNEEWCRANGVSGQWRTAPDPGSALLRKIFEEAGEYAEYRDPGELYDLLDVVQALIDLTDADGIANTGHRAKAARMGGFGRLIEWTPVPATPGSQETG